MPKKPNAMCCALGVGIALSLAGCFDSVSPLNAESPENFEESARAALEALAIRPAQRDRFQSALDAFRQMYAADDENLMLPDQSVVNGMSPEEFVRFVEQLQDGPVIYKPAPLGGELFPDPTYAAAMLLQMEIEREQIRAARQAILDTGKNTIDQYPIIDVGFVPPDETLAVQYDMARFIVKMRNDSGFDAYRPDFRIRILAPEDDVPVVLDRTFSFSEEKEPIAPNEVRMFAMTCCGALDDPWHNAQLKQLPPDAQLEVVVTKVMGHGTHEVLVTQNFGMEDHLRLGLLDFCIERIRGNEATWVPSAEDGTHECAGAEPQAIAGVGS